MPLKVLSVDDSKTIRMILGKAFKPFDCTVLEASNGQECLDVAAREKPDIIILDITMPVMDGVECLKQLKANPDLKTIPVMMLTAETGKDNIANIAQIGVSDYLAKPFKEDQLLEKVKKIVTLQPKPA